MKPSQINHLELLFRGKSYLFFRGHGQTWIPRSGPRGCWRQLSYAIKNQPISWAFCLPWRIAGFHAWEESIRGAYNRSFLCMDLLTILAVKLVRSDIRDVLSNQFLLSGSRLQPNILSQQWNTSPDYCKKSPELYSGKNMGTVQKEKHLHPATYCLSDLLIKQQYCSELSPVFLGAKT